MALSLSSHHQAERAAGELELLLSLLRWKALQGREEEVSRGLRHANLGANRLMGSFHSMLPHALVNRSLHRITGLRYGLSAGQRRHRHSLRLSRLRAARQRHQEKKQQIKQR